MAALLQQKKNKNLTNLTKLAYFEIVHRLSSYKMPPQHTEHQTHSN